MVESEIQKTLEKPREKTTRELLLEIKRAFEWFYSFDNYLNNLSEEEFEKQMELAQQKARRRGSIELNESYDGVFRTRKDAEELEKKVESEEKKYYYAEEDRHYQKQISKLNLKSISKYIIDAVSKYFN